MNLLLPTQTVHTDRYEILEKESRRVILSMLHEKDVCTIDEVVEQMSTQPTLEKDPHRVILAKLYEKDVYTVDELAEQLSSQSSERESDSIRLFLYHRDLPKLADAGLVTYDWQSGEIERTVNTRLISRLVESAPYG